MLSTDPRLYGGIPARDESLCIPGAGAAVETVETHPLTDP